MLAHMHKLAVTALKASNGEETERLAAICSAIYNARLGR